MYNPRELLVYVPVGVQYYVFLYHTSTKNHNETKKGLHDLSLNNSTHAPLSEKDREGKLSDDRFGLKGVGKAMIVKSLPLKEQF